MFEELVPSGLPLLKKHMRLGHAGIVDHFVDLSTPDLKKERKKKIKKEWTEAIKKIHKCTTANTSAILQHAAHTIDRLLSPSWQTKAIPKILSLNEIFQESSEKKVLRMGQ